MTMLRHNLLFSELSEQQFDRVLSASKAIPVQAGQVLFFQQQAAHYFYILETGAIKLYRLAPEGGEKVIEIIRPGQTFAEAVMFMDQGIYPVNAQALTKTQVIRVEMTVFRNILEHSPQTCLKILGHMSRRLHGVVQEIEQLTLQNAKMRVIQYLLNELAPDADSPYLLQWATPKTVLASRLSIRPETFSRILHQLTEEGLIHVAGKRIEIVDVDVLRNY